MTPELWQAFQEFLISAYQPIGFWVLVLALGGGVLLAILYLFVSVVVGLIDYQ